MTRVKVHSQSWGQGCCGMQWRLEEEVGCGCRGQSRVSMGDWCQDCMDMTVGQKLLSMFQGDRQWGGVPGEDLTTAQALSLTTDTAQQT